MVEGKDHTAMIVEREDRLFVTNVTILDILKGNAMQIMIKMMEIKERMYLYVSYVRNLDTWQNFVEWIEGI